KEDDSEIYSNPTRLQKSSNWCGAGIVPNEGHQFVLLFGEWTVPKPELPPAKQRVGQLSEFLRQPNEYHCSTWIGVDGARMYLDSSLPQIGTEQILTVDQGGRRNREYFAWFQWWARTQVHMTRFKLSGLTVDAGVSVMAMIWVIDPHHVVAALRTYK